MLVLPSQLTHAQAPACSKMLEQALHKVKEPVVEVDASALETFDSSALAVLLECRREALTAGKRFAVVALPDRLKVLATLYGVAALLPAVA